jgi:hypothetical protein
MEPKMKSTTLKRLAVWSASITLMLYGLGLGSCSARSIGAGLLSEFLTSGGTSEIDSALGTSLSSIFSSFLGSSTNSTTTE